MRGICSPEQRAQCPLQEHFTDTHHLVFPSTEYRTKIEKKWRELDDNKIQLCRAVHNAIHNSGYIPTKPSRDLMLNEVWNDRPQNWSVDELPRQLYLGQIGLREAQ